MPGSSRVGGTWRTITGLSVKVGGTWRTATSGFIKVGGTWRQWFASKIEDAFNRASTVSGLGTAVSGQIWTALRGNWRISGSNTAISDDAASTYPIASINFGNPDVKSQVDTTGGTGVAFWVSSAGSWWASYPRYTSSTQTFCDQSPVTNTSNPPAGNCCSGVTSSTTSVCDQTQVTNTSNPPSGSCCSGVTTSTVCDQSPITNTSNPPAGNCCSAVTTSGGGTACTGGYVENTSNPPSGSCCSGVSSGITSVCDRGQVNCGTNSSCSGQSCCSGVFATGGGTYSVCDQGQVSSTSNPPANNCCSGVSTSGGGTTTVCDQSLVSNSSNPPSSNCCSGVSSSTTPSTPRSYCCAATYYEKTQAQRLAGYDGCAAGLCGGGDCLDVYTATYCCAPGLERSNYSCYYPATSGGTTYSCYTSTRTVSSPTTYSCYTSTRTVTEPTTYGCYTSTRNVTVYSCYTQQVNQPINYSCFRATSNRFSCFTTTRNVTNYSCFTGTSSVTTYTTALVVASSVSNVVSEAASTTISSNTVGFTNVGSVYVTTVGNNIVARAYSGTGLGGSLLATVNTTPASPTTGTSVGIIKAPSTGSQGSTADNFLTTI